MDSVLRQRGRSASKGVRIVDTKEVEVYGGITSESRRDASIPALSYR